MVFLRFLAERLLLRQEFLGVATKVSYFSIFGVFNLGKWSFYLGDVGIVRDDDD